MLATTDTYVEFDDEIVVVPGRRASSEPPQRRANEMSEWENIVSVQPISEDEEEPPICLEPQPQPLGFEDGGREVLGGTSLDDEEEPSSSERWCSHVLSNMSDIGPQPQNNRTKRQTSKPIQWWRRSTDICPLSHFPINLLPFPPFELWLDEGVVLIDGLFLVYTILSTWKFKVLGMQLMDADIKRLDSYMKKCKLGTLRLGYGIVLKKAKTPEARVKFVTMQQDARERLRKLRLIKRSRLARLTHQNDVEYQDDVEYQALEPSVHPDGGDQTSAQIQCNYWNTNVYAPQIDFPSHENQQFLSWPASSMQAPAAMMQQQQCYPLFISQTTVAFA